METRAPDPAQQPALDVRVEQCGARDREEQARLFNACFKKRVDAQALVWRYDENPHGGAVSLLSRPAGHEGVSGYACSPRIAVPRGDRAHSAPIGETGDVMTHPQWRKRGLFSALDRACMQATARLGWPLVFGLPNRHSAHIFLELGWERIGTLRAFTFLLHGGGESRAQRTNDGGRLQGLLAGLGVRKGRRARARLVREAGARFSTRELARFPEEVTSLSAAVEQRFALMVRRDAAYLDWRFLRGPSRLHRALGVYDEQNAFAGYVVVQLPRAGEPAGYLVDVLARDDATLAAALEAGLARLDAAGARFVRATAVDGSWWSERLQATGFLPPRPENHLIVILYVHQPEHPLARAARDVRAWYLTDGDRDDETMG